MTLQYFSGQVRGLRGPGLTAEQAEGVDAAIAGLATKADSIGGVFGRPATGLPATHGGYDYVTKPPTSGLAANVFRGVQQGTRYVIGEAGGSGRGYFFDLARADPNFGSEGAFVSDLAVASVGAYTGIAAKSLPATARAIGSSSYYADDRQGDAARAACLRRVASGPATTYRTQAADGTWLELDEEIHNPADYGVVGADDDADLTDEAGFIDVILQRAKFGERGRLDRSYLASYYTNLLGLRFDGPGEIVKFYPAHPTGPAMQSGFAPVIWDHDEHRDTFGEEDLLAIRLRLAAGQDVQWKVFGDSTISRYGGSILTDQYGYPQTQIPLIAKNNGFPSRFICGYDDILAKPGTTLEQAMAGNTINATGPGFTNGTTPLMAANDAGVHVIAMKFLLNEFLEAVAAARPGSIDTVIREHAVIYDNAFAQLRAARPVEQLCIIVLGPTSASNLGAQDQRAILRVLPMIRANCRRHEVAYFDMYSRWPDSLRKGLKTFDGAYYPVGHPNAGDPSFGPLHPNAIGWRGYWAAFSQWLGAALETETRTNRVLNLKSGMETPAFAAPPSAYAPNETKHRVLAANGWPADGAIVTHKWADSLDVWQTFRATGSAAAQTRVKNAGADTWSAWA